VNPEVKTLGVDKHKPVTDIQVKPTDPNKIAT